jgi:protein-arginine kinase activator protein McsA
MSEEKMIYRIKAQSKGHTVTITAETSKEVTQEEAIKIAKTSVLVGTNLDYAPFLVEPLCTEEQWEEGHINFCPRCGKNIADMDLGTMGLFECMECGAYVDVNIMEVQEDE